MNKMMMTKDLSSKKKKKNRYINSHADNLSLTNALGPGLQLLYCMKAWVEWEILCVKYKIGRIHGYIRNTTTVLSNPVTNDAYIRVTPTLHHLRHCFWLSRLSWFFCFSQTYFIIILNDSSVTFILNYESPSQMSYKISCFASMVATIVSVLMKTQSTNQASIIYPSSNFFSFWLFLSDSHINHNPNII